jgi:hypothetical protein
MQFNWHMTAVEKKSKTLKAVNRVLHRVMITSRSIGLNEKMLRNEFRPSNSKTLLNNKWCICAIYYVQYWANLMTGQMLFTNLANISK